MRYTFLLSLLASTIFALEQVEQVERNVLDVNQGKGGAPRGGGGAPRGGGGAPRGGGGAPRGGSAPSRPAPRPESRPAPRPESRPAPRPESRPGPRPGPDRPGREWDRPGSRPGPDRPGPRPGPNGPGRGEWNRPRDHPNRNGPARDWGRDCRYGGCGHPDNRGRDWGSRDCRRGGCEGWRNSRGQYWHDGYWRDNRGYVWRNNGWYDPLGVLYPGPSPIIIDIGSYPPRAPAQTLDGWCASLQVDTADLPDECLDICDATNGGRDFCYVPAVPY